MRGLLNAIVKRKAAAARRLTVDANHSAHQTDQPLRNSQAETGATVFAGSGRGKGVEDVRQGSRRNANVGIGNLELECEIGGVAIGATKRNRDLASLGVSRT